MSKSIFFAYPSHPNAVREPAARGADLIAGTGLADTVPWEGLRVGGRFIIDEITSAISSADATACVVTLLNQNVMFELGFAIGVGRPIWLLLDPSHKEGDRRWQDFRILSAVGYSPYVSGEDIQAEFLKDRPELNTEPLVDHIPLEPSSKSSVFYVKALYRTDADVGLTRIVYEIESRGLHVIAADPDEGNVYPLTWYAQQVYASEATIVHFTSEQRTGALVHNARCALVAGIAHGMQRPLLMLAETDYYSPIDYRDALHVYSSANDCKVRARSWLGEVSVVPPDVQEARIQRIKHLRLATELASLRLGEDVAEQESDRLSDYFIETYSYRQVLERRTTLFVGRKGTGKTANLLRAMAELGADLRNLEISWS